jgi:hypothetical protein
LELEGRLAKVEAWESRIGKLEQVKVPDTANFIRRDQQFKLGFDQHRCITFPTGVSRKVVGPIPDIIMAQALVLLVDCAGSQPLMFK